MNARHDLIVYAPSDGQWQPRIGNIRLVNYGDNSLGVTAPARQLSKEDRFEVTAIPGAMAKMGWHRSAALLNKWLHYAPKNQANSSFQKAHGINRDLRSGAYPQDRFDLDTVSLDWVLSYPRTQSGFKKLQSTHYLSSGTSEALARTVHPYLSSHSRLDTIKLTGGNIQELHNRFQFQLFKIDTTPLEKATQFFNALLHYGQPDDLAGALGGFAMYAAIAEARFQPAFFGGIDVEITKVAIYVKNPYSFFDDPKDGGSQYLGHWNKDGILLVPEGYAAQKASLGEWSNYVVQPEGPYGRTFWPIRNRDFRRWQDAHNAGGDMVLFSDYRVVEINPIRVRVSK